MKPAPAIDLARRLLQLLGWSVGEACFTLPNGSCYWQVDATRGGHLIVVTADSQAEAWWECCRQAGVVQRDGG